MSIESIDAQGPHGHCGSPSLYSDDARQTGHPTVPADMIEALRAGLYIEFGAANEAPARTWTAGHDPDPDRYKRLDAARRSWSSSAAKPLSRRSRFRWTWTNTACRYWRDYWVGDISWP